MPQTDAPTWEDTEAIPTWDETRPLLSDTEMGQMAAKPPMQFLPGGMNDPGVASEAPFTTALATFAAGLAAPAMELATRPLVNPKTSESDLRFRKAHPVIGGIEEGVVNLAKGFTSPIGIATLGVGALPSSIARPVSLAFAAQMMSSMPEVGTELGTEFGKPPEQRDTQKISKLLTEAAGTAWFTKFALQHGLTPTPKAAPIESRRATEIAPVETEPPRFEDTSPIPEGDEMQFPVQEIQPKESNASSIEPATQVGLRGQGEEVGGSAPLRQQGAAANLPPQEGAVGRGGAGQAPEEKAPNLSKEASNVEKGILVEAQDHPKVAATNPELLRTLAEDELKLDPNAYKGDEVKQEAQAQVQRNDVAPGNEVASVVSPPENRVKTGETEGGGSATIAANESKRTEIHVPTPGQIGGSGETVAGTEQLGRRSGEAKIGGSGQTSQQLPVYGVARTVPVRPLRMTHKQFIDSGGTEAGWDEYAKAQNEALKLAGENRVVEAWKTTGANGNDVANLLRGRGIAIPEQIAKALQHDDTVVSQTGVTGRGFTRSEAAKIHRFVLENMPSESTPPATSAGVETKQPTIEGGQGPLLVAEMVKAANESVAQLRSRISNVKYGDAAKNEIKFDVDGKPHTAVLRGRNRDLILGSSPEADAAVAVRAILDGDSTWKPTPSQSSTQSPRSGTAEEAIRPSTQFEQRVGSLPPSPETKPAKQPVNWDALNEDLADNLDSFSPARSTGKVNYELRDMAQRFVDYAKADQSGLPLLDLVKDFAKQDEATAGQIKKLRAALQDVAPKYEPEKHLGGPPSELPPDKQAKSAQAGKLTTEGIGRELELANKPAEALASPVKLTAEEKADPRMDEPGVTRRSTPNTIIIQLRDLESRPIREVMIAPSGDLMTDAQNVVKRIRQEAADDNRISLRESAATSTNNRGMGVYHFTDSPNGPAFAKVVDLVKARERTKSPPPEPPPSPAGAGEKGKVTIKVPAYMNRLQNEKVTGRIIKLKSDPGNVYVAYQPSKGSWKVVEKTTGLSPGDTYGKTRADSIAKAEANAAKAGAGKMAELVAFAKKLNPEPQPTPPPSEPPSGGAGEKPIGMGGAVPSEFAQSPQTPTSIKNAQVDIERSKRGLPPAIQPARKSFGAVWDEAMAKIDQDPGFQDRLLSELRDKPRALTDLEDALLLHRQIDLQNEYGKATRDLAQAYEDGRVDDVISEKARVQALSDALYDIYQIGKRVGTETGRGLNARRMMAFEDFTLAKMELEKRAIKDGAPLTDSERAEVQRLHDKIAATQKAYDDYVAATEKRDAERAIQDALREVEQKAKAEVEPHIRIIADKIKTYFDNRADAALKRLSGKLFTLSPQVLTDLTDLGVSRILGGAARLPEWSVKMVEVLGERIRPHLQTIWESSNRALDEHIQKVAGTGAEKVKRVVKGTDTAEKKTATTEAISEKVNSGQRNDITGLVQKLARLFVQEGIRNREELIDAVHGVLKGIDPEFTRRETMDAISGYGQFKQLSKDEISVQLRDLKGQMQQVAKIEDMQSKIAPKKTGVERRSPSDEERRLIKLVNEQKRKGGFVVTDPATQLASALQARKTYYENRITDLKAEIAARERTVKTKTPSPTDAKLDALKAEYEAVKKEHSEIFKKPGLTDAQRLDMAEKSATRQIAELERQFRTGEIFPAGKNPFTGTSVALEAAKAKIEALKAERDWARMAAEPSPQPLDVEAQRRAESLDKQIRAIESQIKNETVFPKSKAVRVETPENEARLKRLSDLKQEREFVRERLRPSPQPLDVEAQQRSASLDRRIAELQSQIEHETVFTKGKTERVETPENQAKLKEIEDLKQQRQFIRERLQPKPERDSEAIALAATKARLKRQAANLIDRLARGDFAPRQKRIIQFDAEANRLHFEAMKAKTAWHEAMMKDRLARRSIPAKIFGGALEAMNTARAVMTSADLSAVLRQGGFIAFAHPIRAAKSFPAMFRAFRSEAGQHAVNQEILARKNYPLYQQSKLYLSEHGHKLSQMEEAYMTRWADKIPLVAGSQRAYVTFLNKLRADSFDAMANSLAREKELTTNEASAISNFINVATGRGNLGMKENALVGLNSIFFAPRYVASRFQLLAGQPFYRGSARTRTLMAQEYGRFLIGVAIVYGLAKLDGAQIETDPRSADFGKLRYGNTRIDPLAGLLQTTVLLSRLASGETKTAGGHIVPIRGDKVPYGGADSAEVIGRFLRSKLSPALGTGLNVLTGKDVVGQPVTASAIAQNLLIPLAWQDIYKTMREQGVDHGTAMAILSIFGMGLQNYDEKKKAPQPFKLPVLPKTPNLPVLPYYHTPQPTTNSITR